MVSGRPLLYLSLPGVAFILGVFWFRRRNKNRPRNMEKSDGLDISRKKEELENILENDLRCNFFLPESQSMNIDANASTAIEKATPKIFGKSAPIQIVSNGRCSPVTQPQQVDCDKLRKKTQDTESIALRLIDEDFENMTSSVDLPDSLNRISFHSRMNTDEKDEPVVITATRTPKITPENSFLESKYSKKECEEIDDIVVEESKNVELEGHKEQHEIAEQENGKDKRNVDAASPPLSLCSVQSGDSGKGSSLPRSEATRAKTAYEFFFPTGLIGHLYGRNRSFINQITSETNAKVSLRKNPFSAKVKICVIEGSEAEIAAATMMIRQRLPTKRYPNFTMQRIHAALPQTVVPLSTENMVKLKLNLIEGINNDVVVSVVISGGHVFVQQPLHPSHPSLVLLQKYLNDSYSNSEAPPLPGIEIGAVCVLAVNGVWYRVQIIDKNPENDQKCMVTFLDYGGYVDVDFNELRQIRSDFMGIPFQATECMLSNIEPLGSSWTVEAADILTKLTKGIILQAQIAGYNSLNVPEIYLFACLGPNNIVFINKELVARNLAKWVEVQN